MLRKWTISTFFCLVLFCCSVQATNKNNGHKLPESTGYGLVENKGQITDQYGTERKDILFAASHSGIKLFLKRNSFTYEVFKEEVSESKEESGSHWDAISNKIKNTKIKYHRIDITLLGANADPLVFPEDEAGDFINYSNTQGQSQRAHHYKKVTYKEIYPNIDLVFHYNSSGAKYDFVVRPGGRLSDIQLNYSGMNDLTLLPDGNLVIGTALGNLTENIPLSFSVDRSGNSKKDIKVVFQRDGNTIRFDAAPHNTSHTLIVDPVIQWSTYYGGLDKDECYGTARSGLGSIVVAGYTNSNTNIATIGAHQSVYGGGFFDAFVIKFDTLGARQWATYYGGPGANIGTDVATDTLGNVILTGYTEQSSGVPTPGSHQATYGGGTYDAFVAKFDSMGVLQWATYYGGTNADYGTSIVSGMTADIYVVGYTASTAAISTPGSHQPAYGGGSSDGFVVKFNAAGVRQWASYYGGSDTDEMLSVGAYISMKYLAMAGYTKSAASIATPSSHQPVIGGNEDAFVVDFTPSGGINWATYYGGTDVDFGQGVDVEKCGYVALAGYTKSTNAIATGNPVHQQALSGLEDAFVATFDSTGIRDWGTYYGGTDVDRAMGVEYSLKSRYVAITGYTQSSTDIARDSVHPLTALGGAEDAFLADFSPFGVLRSGTYLGGPTNDRGYGIAGNNPFWISGSTESVTGVASSGAFQTAYGGGTYDGFVARIVVKPRRTILSCGPPGPCTPSYTSGCLMGCVSMCGPDYDDETAGAIYSWNFSGGNPPTSSEPSPQGVCYTIPGTYSPSVDVGNPAGGDPTLTYDNVVIVYPLPDVITGNDTTICPGTSLTLNASGALIYSWSPPTGLDNANVFNPVASPSGTTTYIVTGIDGNGCSDTADITITIPASVDAGPDTSFCFGSGVQLNAVNTDTYLWTPATGLDNAAISNPFASPVNTETYYVTGTDSSGCQTTDSVTITVNQLPLIDAGPPVTICGGGSTQLNASGGNAYVWSPSAGLSNTLIANPVATVFSNSTYIVNGTDGNGCSNSDSVSISVFTQIPIDAGVDTTICTGGTVQLNATGGGSNYLWTPSAGLNNANIANPVATVTGITTYYVTITDNNSCTDTAAVTINVWALPIVNAGNDTTTCMGVSVQLNASGGLSYIWSPPAGLSDSAIANPVATIDSTAIYTVTATDVNGCSNSDNVTVQATSDSVLQGDFASEINYCSLQIGVQSNFGDSVDYSWNFGDGFTSSSSSPVHIYSNYNGTYNITLMVHTTSGCYNGPNSWDTITHTVELNKDAFINSLILPNVFTPNGDGVNELFQIGGIDCLPYYFVIYDRWGVKMFETDETYHFWDGTVFKNGKPATDGLYYYLLRFGYYSESDPKTEIAGFVHLIR